MKISGFTIVRNGVLLQYPFVEAITSALPLVDEFIVVVGKGEDNTRDMVVSIPSDKIKIVDTVWDPALRTNGTILAQQTNIGIEACSGDWLLYLQADELIHEKDIEKIKSVLFQLNDVENIDGILFDYYHFWGYQHICATRRTYRREIRVIRNSPDIFSYKDAQGFRKYSSKESYINGDKGEKLKVAHCIGPHIYAYSRVRNAKDELEKVKHIAQFWHTDEVIKQKYEEITEWDYNNIDVLIPFALDNHPTLMKQKALKDSIIILKDEMRFPSIKHQLLYYVEKLTGWRVGEYRNYKKIKRV